MIVPAASTTVLPLHLVIGVSLVLVALLGGVFVLPYAAPSQANVISASSLAGYNNAAAYGMYLLLGTLATILMARALARFPMSKPVSTPLAVRWAPSPLLLWVCLGHIAVFGILYAFKGYFAFGDGMYFQHILARMTLGDVPYRDVNFLYGPAMLYPAFWLAQFLGVTAAYGLYYSLVYLVGLYVLYVSVQAIAVDPQESNKLFLLLALGLFNLLLGLNYVFLRHLLPMASLLSFWWYVGRPSVPRFLVAASVLFGTLAYSLDMGILAMVGLLGLALLKAVRPWLSGLLRRLVGLPGSGESSSIRWTPQYLSTFLQAGAVCAVAGGGWVAVFYAVDPSLQALGRSLQPILSYSSGAGNSPIYPSLPMLSLIAVSLCGFAVVLRIAGEMDGDRADLFLALLGLALLLQRAAFGKPDAPHIAYSGLPMFLLAFLFMPVRIGGLPARRWLYGTLLVGIVIPMWIFNLGLFKPAMDRYVNTRTSPPGEVASGSLDTRAAMQQSLRRAFVHFGPDRTYYLHILAYYSLPLVLDVRPRQVPYFSTLEEAFNDQDMAAIIHELTVRRAVVISRRQDLGHSAPPLYGTGEGWFYQMLGAPFPGSRSYFEVVKANDRLREPLNAFLRSAYDEAFSDGDLIGLVPKRTTVS